MTFAYFAMINFGSIYFWKLAITSLSANLEISVHIFLSSLLTWNLCSISCPCLKCRFSDDVLYTFSSRFTLLVVIFFGATYITMLPYLLYINATSILIFTWLSYQWPFFRFKIFNPAVVYDHLGEIFSALIFGSLVFCIFLYIKVRIELWHTSCFKAYRISIYISITNSSCI